MKMPEMPVELRQYGWEYRWNVYKLQWGDNIIVELQGRKSGWFGSWKEIWSSGFVSPFEDISIVADRVLYEYKDHLYRTRRGDGVLGVYVA